MAKKNYLNNKDILKEIHKSKVAHSRFTLKEYEHYDIIVHSLEEIPYRIQQAKAAKAKLKGDTEFAAARENGKLAKRAEFDVDPDSFSKLDLVFRVMTFDHIPDDPNRKAKPKTIADTKAKVNFPPFQHWKYNEEGKLVCVGKSHWSGTVEDGEFSTTSGKATDNLALMWLKLISRYASRGNVRNYTYNDEMQCQAVLQLSQTGLQFDESKSDNPFAYYTRIVNNSFVRVLNAEKRNQDIRDDILEMNDFRPSYTRINNAEWDAECRRNEEDLRKGN